MGLRTKNSNFCIMKEMVFKRRDEDNNDCKSLIEVKTMSVSLDFSYILLKCGYVY